MSFYTITTFEKPGVQVESEIWATPGWFKFSRCFMIPSPNSFIEQLSGRFNSDLSYVEYHLVYHNEDAYRAWHESYKHIHDGLRKECLANLRARGVTVNLYWPGEELGGNEVIIPLSDFVSKIT